MWQPTHVQVTVQRAKRVLIKGKNDTNDTFVVIALGKEKFQTSIKEKSTCNVEWHEECDLEIPRHGNTAALQLSVYHRNALGMDEFLGQVSLPLSEFDVYERPRTRSYKLLSKPDKAKKKAEKDRGELEVKIAFIVKSGEHLEAGKKEKHKSSLSSIKHSIGGSLLSLGNKEKQGLKKFTKSVSHRMDKLVPKKKKGVPAGGDDYIPSQLMSSRQWSGQADPGVISDEEEDDLAFDDMKVGSIVSSTANSSPYSTVSSRTSSRHKPRIMLDEDSLGGIDYPPPQIVHHSPQDRDEDMKLESDETVDSKPSDTSRSEPSRTTSTSDAKQDDSHGTSPPSPDPFSLNINYANMTPVQLPVLKTKPRKVFDETASAAPNASSPPAAPLTSAKSFGDADSGISDSTQSVSVGAKQAPTPLRRSSVPSQNKPLVSANTDYDLSRSSSQSSGFVTTEQERGPYKVPVGVDSPLSTRSAAQDSPLSFRSSTRSRTSNDGVRGGSVKEKRMSQPIEDEWERKLCGRRSMVGSMEGLSSSLAGGSSHSSLNASLTSSTHESHIHRLPEVKALSLERSSKLSPSSYASIPEPASSGKKTKRKGFKSRLFGGGGNRERVEEEETFRVVEGGNDKLPNAPASNPHSRLSQEIHNKFAGKSREDLMEQILGLQSSLNRQVQHSRDLEEYIDNLLARVLDASPHLLQAPALPGRKGRHYLKF